MNDRTKRLILTLSGQTGSTVLSILALSLAIGLHGEVLDLGWEMILTVALLRILSRVTRGPLPVLDRRSIPKRAWRVLIDESVMGAILVTVAFILAWPIAREAAASYLGINLAFQMIWFVAVRWLLAVLAADLRRLSRNAPQRQTVIVGTGPQAREAADRILDAPELETFLIGFLDYHRKDLWRYRDAPLLGHPDELCKIISTCQVDALIIAVEGEDLPLTKPVFNLAEQMGVTICLMSDIFQPRIASVRPDYVNGVPTLVYRAVPENQLSLLAKSVIDRVGALVGIVLAAPIMLAAALCIKLNSRGPVFFTQIRSGLNGKPFRIIKFRTMDSDAEGQKAALQSQNEMSGPVFKMKDDPRVTRVGKFLRRTSIDELPQFFNVLIGQMSLVGPRPPLPKEVVKYQPWQHRKLSVRPGVTCLWQVSGRNGIDFEDWMKLDLEYIDNWSLWLDAKIIARTIPAVIKTSGAS
jgi:exopolysaccharide biosynthesis polyprenyl glycosylphosphotransferase